MAIFPQEPKGKPVPLLEMIGMGMITLGISGYVLKVAVESIQIPSDLSHIEPGSPFNLTTFLLIGSITLLMVMFHILIPREAVELDDLLPAHVTIPEPWRMP